MDKVRAHKLEYTEQDGIVLRGNRIVIPNKIKSKILEIAHQGHIGISKAKAALREKVQWIGMDKDIDEQFGKCLACQANSTLPTPEPVTMSTLSDAP